MAAIDLSQAATRARKEQSQHNGAATPELVEAETAFLIYRKKDGGVILTDNINLPVTAERKLTPEEMMMQMFIATETIKAQKTAGMAAQAFMEMSMQMAQQMQAVGQLDGLGDLRV